MYVLECAGLCCFILAAIIQQKLRYKLQPVFNLVYSARFLEQLELRCCQLCTRWKWSGMKGQRAKTPFFRKQICEKPAHVAQWSKHSGVMYSRVWHTQEPGFKPRPWHVRLPNKFFQIIPMHTMNREIIPGRKKTVRLCLLSTVTIADTFISSVKAFSRADMSWSK